VDSTKRKIVVVELKFKLEFSDTKVTFKSSDLTKDETINSSYPYSNNYSALTISQM